MNASRHFLLIFTASGSQLSSQTAQGRREHRVKWDERRTYGPGESLALPATERLDSHLVRRSNKLDICPFPRPQASTTSGLGPLVTTMTGKRCRYTDLRHVTDRDALPSVTRKAVQAPSALVLLSRCHSLFIPHCSYLHPFLSHQVCITLTNSQLRVCGESLLRNV